MLGACACLLISVSALVVRNAEESADKQELFWGGPLSFDMVHTHILNMKMRRSRLKEKLKEAALKRKDRELAKEHGFNSQGSKLSDVAAPPQPAQPPAPMMYQQQAPPQYAYPPQQPAPPQYPQYNPAQQPQLQAYPPQDPQYAPQPQYPQYAQQPGYPQAPMPEPQLAAQPPQYPQYPQAAPPQYPPEQAQPQYPPQYEAPPNAAQLAQAPMYPQPAAAAAAPANPWGGATYNAAQYQQVAPSGPTESSEDDKEQQRAQAAASIQAYEAFMHGGPAAVATPKAHMSAAQSMMMHA